MRQWSSLCWLLGGVAACGVPSVAFSSSIAPSAAFEPGLTLAVELDNARPESRARTCCSCSDVHLPPDSHDTDTNQPILRKPYRRNRARLLPFANARSGPYPSTLPTWSAQVVVRYHSLNSPSQEETFFRCERVDCPCGRWRCGHGLAGARDDTATTCSSSSSTTTMSIFASPCRAEVHAHLATNHDNSRTVPAHIPRRPDDVATLAVQHNCPGLGPSPSSLLPTERRPRPESGREAGAVPLCAIATAAWLRAPCARCWRPTSV